MKSLSKWVAIIWSVFCFFGVIAGIANVGDKLNTGNEFEQAGTTIGVGCGLGIWLVLWLVITGPAIVIYLVSGKKEKNIDSNNISIVKTKSQLCPECGKYFEGEPQFCPNCGKETKFKIN
jgi:ribosomal protein S27AE